MKSTYEIASCPVCGSDETAEVANRDAIRDELASLWEFHTRRMRPTADARMLTDRVAFSQDPPLRIARCSQCTHLFRNPRERAITSLYGDEAVDAQTLELLYEAQRSTFARQIERLDRATSARGNGLEIGSYVGAFLDAARTAGWQFEGVDVNQDAAAFARGKGFTVHAGTIGDTPARARYDVIAFWNCFEQLDDVRAAARAAHARLHDNGIMTVRVPNGDYWRSLRSHMSGPLRPFVMPALAQNNLLTFPYRNGFTRQSLRMLVERNGFEVIDVYGEFSLPVDSAGRPWWVAVEGVAANALVRAMRRLTGAPWIEMYARKIA
jgi:2-polyprenyl-3-methyl-5-hydroxy-6-metoxy-1,4-benzoquinol methylase